MLSGPRYGPLDRPVIVLKFSEGSCIYFPEMGKLKRKKNVELSIPQWGEKEGNFF